MPLTDAEIEATKVPYGRNQYKVSDGGGLYLLVKSSGRYWKLAYRFEGKQKSLALGVYPSVALEEAREKRDAAKALLAQNIDPGELRKQERIEQRAATDSQETSEEPSNKLRSERPAALSQEEQQNLEDRRLCILMILAGSKTYATNEAQLLQDLEDQGHGISFDRLRTDIAWLYEQHAVQLKSGALWGVYLTHSGLDAAQGRMWIPGIKRPETDVQAD
ncbi:protein of unknown function (DUF4102) [Mariprofundus ferrinatatus]|uniref:Integrase DNA-binding domain-containing protein n=1 Tax=Mariprofundus ferrinatatus TaxID=1921087 RepID=A0A2K8L3V2_9PROT|nr:Arm DNA-binding domain-containing protein [Mariprofundus ferrinatatus]ATX81967.1 protein of unknown function (DUF4102) [Mariprofundus ferrinatatus]